MEKSEVMEKAILLAEAITQSPECAELKRWEEEMIANESAQQLLLQWQKAHTQYMEKQKSGSELSEADEDELIEIQKKAKDNQVMMAFMTAHNNFQEMLQGVNDIVSSAIATVTGGSPSEEDLC